jgi:hypothetical protein
LSIWPEGIYFVRKTNKEGVMDVEITSSRDYSQLKTRFVDEK